MQFCLNNFELLKQNSNIDQAQVNFCQHVQYVSTNM